jgi:hypothetical protein
MERYSEEFKHSIIKRMMAPPSLIYLFSDSRELKDSPLHY